MSFDSIASLTRRKFIAGSAAVAAVAFVRDVHAQAPSGPFKLDPLPYPNNALEPHIDARTMEIHHDRHHAAYVTNLNNAVKDHSNVASMPLQEILAKLPEMPEAIRRAAELVAQGATLAISPRRLRATSAACRSCRTTSTPPGCACSARAGCSSPSRPTASLRWRRSPIRIPP